MLTIPNKAADVQQASEQLLLKARQVIDGMDQYFQTLGLDPDEARKMISTLSTAEINAEAKAKFEQINHEIARNIDQKRVELGLASGGSAGGAAKRQRSMV